MERPVRCAGSFCVPRTSSHGPQPSHQGVPDLEAAMPQLKSLVLDDNGISDWGVLRRAVTAFPGLEVLHLNANLLGSESEIESLMTMGADQTPRRLTALCLNENKLSSWRAVGALTSYALLELKLQRNPLTEGSGGEKPCTPPQLLRQVLIALMPSLLRLNASEVSVKERKSAERFFLSAVQRDNVFDGLKDTCDVDTLIKRLKEIHGDVATAIGTEEEQANRASLAHNLVTVKIRPFGTAIIEQQMHTKKLPHSMTVAELKRLCFSLFKKVPLDSMKLLFNDPSLPFGIPFEDDSRDLGFYGVSDTSEIHVHDTRDSEVPTQKARNAQNAEVDEC